MSFDFEGALKAGYTPQEISEHLNFNYQGAKSAGYSDEEILKHLRSSKEEPSWSSKMEEIEPSVKGVPNPSGKPNDTSILGRIKAGAEGLGATAWGIPAMVGGVISGLSEKVTNPESDFEQNTSKWTNEYQSLVQPSTQEGVDVQEQLGHLITRYGLGMIGTPHVPGLSAKERASISELKKAGNGDPIKAKLDSYLAEQKAKETGSEEVASTKLPETMYVDKNGVTIPESMINDPGLAQAKATLDAHEKAVFGRNEIARDQIVGSQFGGKTPPMDFEHTGLLPDISAIERENPMLWPGESPVEEPRPLPTFPEDVIKTLDGSIEHQYRDPNGPIFGRLEGGDWSGDIRTPFPELPKEIEWDRLSKSQIEQLHRTGETTVHLDGSEIPFKLKLEVLQDPAIVKAITDFRQEAADLQQVIDNAINKKVKENHQKKLEVLQDHFLEGMRQLGIDNPQEALGLSKLFESGKETKLPIEHGFSFGKKSKLGGVGKKQGGAIDPEVFLSLFPKFRGTRVADSNGRPLPVYHGTTHRGKPQETPISKFRTPTGTTTIYDGTDAQGNKHYVAYPGSLGTWHSSTPEGTKAFSSGIGGTIYESYINLQNPKVFNSYYEFKQWIEDNYRDKSPNYIRRELLKKEIDGIQINNSTTDGGGTRTDYVTFRPEDVQSSTGASKLGKHSFGQGGSWVPFGKKDISFNEFARKYPGYPQDVLARVYEETVGKAPELDKKPIFNEMAFTDKILPLEDLVKETKGVPDIPEGKLVSNHAISRNIMSSSRMFKEWVEHPVFSQISNIITTNLEDARTTSRRVLDDVRTGIINNIHKQVIFKGNSEIKEYFRWRYSEEGKSGELPAIFSEKIREIHEKETKASSDLFKAMNEIRELKNQKRVDELSNHMIHMWKGPYRFMITAVGENGVKKVVTYIAEKSSKDAAAASKWYKENFPEYEQTPVEFITTKEMSKASVFDHILDLASTKDPLVIEALDKIMQKQEQSSYRFLSQQNRFKNRTGKEGWVGNKPWLSEKQNYKETIDALRYKYDAGWEWVANNKARMETTKIKDALKADFPKALSLGEKYFDHAFGRNRELGKVTEVLEKIEKNLPATEAPKRVLGDTLQLFSRVTIPYLLSWKFSHVAQSVSQPLLVIPRMAMLDTRLGGNSLHIPLSFAEGMMDGIGFLANYLSLDLVRPMLNDISKKDSISTRIRNEIMTRDIGRVALIDENPLFGEGGKSRSIANFTYDSLLNSPLSLFEGPSRAWAYGSFVRKFVRDGFEIDKALDMAHAQMDVMTNYNPEGAAPIFQKLGLAGSEAKGLHTFAINYYSQLAKYTSEFGKSIAKLEPSRATPLMLFLGYTLAFAGAVGMIGVDLADWLWSITKEKFLRGSKYDSPEIEAFTVRGFMMENLPEYLAYGPVSTMTDTAVYGPFTTKMVDPNRSFLENVFPRTVASVDIATGMATLPGALLSGNKLDIGNSLEKASPKALTPFIRRNFSEKENSNTGNTVLIRNGREKGMPLMTRTKEEQRVAEDSSLGFGKKSLSEASYTDKLYANKQANKNINEGFKAQVAKLDEDISSGNDLGPRIKSLIETWGMSSDSLVKHLQDRYQGMNIPDAVLRDLVKSATQTSVSSAKRLKKDAELYKERR